MNIKNRIVELFDSNKVSFTKKDKTFLEEFLKMLTQGKIRTAERIENTWKVNRWIKKGILLAFKMGKIVPMPPNNQFFDKDTIPQRKFKLSDGLRIVPGGSSVRIGAFIAGGTTIMPPAFVNIGAYVDSGTMIDSHALVGSCAQIGKNVHLSASSQIGGVLEPIGLNPVIIEDNVFVGGNSGIYEGVLVKESVIIAAGTIITAGTPIYDNTKEDFLPRVAGVAPVIPKGAVVVPGSRKLKNNNNISLYCPVIIKYRDAKSDLSTTLEEILR